MGLAVGTWAVAIALLFLVAAPVNGQQQPQLRTSIVDQKGSIQDNARRILNSLLYPYEQYKPSTIGDSNPLVQWNLKFPFPFYGFLFNYTWVSLNGHLAFSRAPSVSIRPLIVPIDDWPLKPDPSFIGPFHMEAAIGEKVNSNDLDPGVYVRILADLGSGSQIPPGWSIDETRNEEMAIKYALIRDIQDGIIGAEYFNPKHAIIITWRNVTFNGGTTGAKKITNTFQTILATDEIISYCIFNYEQLKWNSATNANGGPGDGLGGTPAFVGFNAGNGTRAFQYMPYSQNTRIMNLLTNGYANNKPGRHIFRIDEQVYQGVCNFEPGQGSAPLFISPNSGTMMGGVLVNMTGPCFVPDQRIKAKFKDVEVTCKYRDRNHATCITPQIFYIGYVDVQLSTGDNSFQFKNQFYLEPPSESKEVVYVKNREDLHKIDPTTLELVWTPGNLTYNPNAPVTISLWGYRENGPTPKVVFIDTLVESTPNRGNIILSMMDYADRDNKDTRDLGFGFIQINMSNPTAEGLDVTSQLWSHPIPIAWYFYPQWSRFEGPEWPRMACDNWIQREDRLNNFARNVPRCPCMLPQALADKGRFAPDPECDMNMNTGCYTHKEAKHCVRTGVATFDGNGQQCCYDNDHYLILTADTPYGGAPARAHPFGGIPYFDTAKVPSLSHWTYDIMPYYFCCRWQNSETEGCWTYRQLRASQDCKGYQSPNASGIFGDPHFVTFDNLEYSFNGLGEYVLTRVNDRLHQIDIQGRFQQVIDEQKAIRLQGSEMKSVAMKENISSTVEVQLRNIEARWRYRLDVLVDHNRVYFDRPHQKNQAFRGVTVYVPGNIHNQSLVVVQFQSGAGVVVSEGNGHMAVTIMLPRSYMNSTRGLTGNWSGTQDDEFTLPTGEVVLSPSSGINNFQAIHQNFGLKWVVKDSEDLTNPVGKSLFYHEYGRSSGSYFNASFQPVYDRKPIIYSNTTLSEAAVTSFCSSDTSYQCYFDYVVTENKDFAYATLQSLSQLSDLKTKYLVPVKTCGALWTPRHGHKSTRQYGLNTRVSFFCEPDYLLIGDVYRDCLTNGEWSEEEDGETFCIEEYVYNAQSAGATTGIVLASLIVGFLVVVLLLNVLWRLRKYDDTYDTGETGPRMNSTELKEISTLKSDKDSYPEKSSFETSS